MESLTPSMIEISQMSRPKGFFAIFGKQRKNAQKEFIRSGNSLKIYFSSCFLQDDLATFRSLMGRQLTVHKSNETMVAIPKGYG